MNSRGGRNIILFAAVSSIWAIVMGFIGPFYVLQVEKLSGGMEKLGAAFGIMVLLQSITPYYAGRFSDRLGRKPFLLLAAYTDAAVLFSYTVIHETYQLYILQAILGVTNGINGTIRTSLLGDMTMREKRGATIGKFNAAVSFSSAIGLFLGGYLVKLYGLKSLFYLASACVALSTALLFFMREEEAGGQ